MIRPRVLVLALAAGLGLVRGALAADAPKAPPAPFAVSGVEVVAERDRPQVCFSFSAPLEETRRVDYAAYVAVVPAIDLSAVARDNSLCLEGFAHGAAYQVTLRKGLPGTGAAALGADKSVGVTVPDRKPSLSFRGEGYILPRIDAAGLPLRTVNIARANLSVLRINDRSVLEQIYNGRAAQALSEWDVGAIVAKSSTEVWKGEMAIGGRPNQPAVTAFPIEALLGKLTPGVYIAVADNADAPTKDWRAKATQWFLVSDLGLTTFTGDDGLMVFARRLKTAAPAAGVEVRLFGHDKHEIAHATTGPDGIARFAPDVIHGTGDKAVQSLFAYGASGDFSFIDLAGGTAEARPQPLDAYVFTDRAAYRPGDAVHVGALLRDGHGAVAGRPLILTVERPDGFVVDRRVLNDAGAGGYAADLRLPPQADLGTWSVVARLDAAGPAVGRAHFHVGTATPARVALQFGADRAAIGPDGKASLSVAARYLDGVPAAGLPGELSLTLQPASDPYPQWAGYHFGLAQESFAPQRRSLPGFTTGADGNAHLRVVIGDRPHTSLPLEAVLRASVIDVGGRPVARQVVLPIHDRPFAIGIRPRNGGSGGGDTLPEGATAGFDVVAVGPDGDAIGRPGLSWELFEEQYAFDWYANQGRWDYRRTVKDRRLAGGTIDAVAGKPVTVEQPVAAGHYRLEVYDAKTGVASSVRFTAGWWVAPTVADRPDHVGVTLDRHRYAPGQTARVFIRPPYKAEVLVVVADRRVRHTELREIGPEGGFLDLPVDPAWGAGVYVTATAFAPADADHAGAPRRAFGMAWLGLEEAAHTLSVTVGAPAATAPRHTVTIPVAVAGMTPGTPAYVMLTAADDGLQAADGSASPDPVAHYLGRQPFGLDLRDPFGSLVEPAAAQPRRAHGHDHVPVEPGMAAADLAPASPIVAVGPDGVARVPLDLPDAEGVLRLTAIAWSADKLGSGHAAMAVRDPVSVALTVPAVLEPGDRAQLAIRLDHAASAGAYTIHLKAAGAVSLAAPVEQQLHPAAHRPATAAATLVAGPVGGGSLVLDVAGPGGFALQRRYPVTVRAPAPMVFSHRTLTLVPGQARTVGPDAAVGLRPETASIGLVAGTGPIIDVPGLLRTLDPTPPGSTDALVSAAFPLLYLDGEATRLGIATSADLRARVQAVIERLLTLQRADGAFAAWLPRGDAQAWLTGYALDFLTRARAKGYAVPDHAIDQGIDWLQKALQNGWIEDVDLPGLTYARYVLARLGKGDAAALRYLYDKRRDEVPTDLARAQLAAALAMVHDPAAADAFAHVDGPRVALAGMHDHGSVLRDLAGAVAVSAEAGLGKDGAAAKELASLEEELAREAVGADVLTGEERAWLLLAAHAMAGQGARPDLQLTVDGKPWAGKAPLIRPVDPAGPAVTIANTGKAPVGLLVSAAGVPSVPPPPESDGLRLRQAVLDRNGKPADLAALHEGDLLVVILEGEAQDPSDREVLVEAPLPAGWRIEDVRHAGSGPLGDLTWLGSVSETRHVGSAGGRFDAVVDLGGNATAFRLVYLVRATVPGSFALPPATARDLDDAHVFARGPAATVTVLGPAARPGAR